MQKKGINGNLIPSFSFLLILVISLMFTHCKHSTEKVENPSGGNRTQMRQSEIYPAIVKYRSFQNTDSTWGYTIFVNSKPYLHYSSIPIRSKGFPMKKEAEMVAEILVKMIENGEPSPKLSKQTMDSIELQMKLIETSNVTSN